MTRRAVSRACGHRLQFFTGAIVYAPHESSLLGGTFGPGWATVVGQSKCARCGETMPLGPSNDAPDEVQVEMAAARIASKWAPLDGEGFLVVHGWHCHRDGCAVLHLAPTSLAGYLARCIVQHDHDRITEHGND
jgi:hypothetical protein